MHIDLRRVVTLALRMHDVIDHPRPPTQQEGAIYRDIAPKVDGQLTRLRAIESTDLAAFNALMRELNVPAVLVTAPPIVP